jgi:hypothetical protein
VQEKELRGNRGREHTQRGDLVKYGTAYAAGAGVSMPGGPRFVLRGVDENVNAGAFGRSPFVCSAFVGQT